MNLVDESASNVIPITRAVAVVVKDYVARAMHGIIERLTDLEKRISEIPAGEKGEPGAKGNDGAVGAAGPAGQMGAVGPPGAEGPRGPQGEKGEKGAMGEPGAMGARGETGTDGPPGKDGQPGERGEPGQPGVDGKDGARGESGAKGIDGKDGAPGRDALELDILPAIDERKMYPRGTYATHRGGLWRTHKTSNGLDGWECLVQGVNGIVVKQIDARNFEVAIEMSVASKSFPFAVPSQIYREVFKAGDQYQQGDGVTYAGAYWIARRDTTDRPGEGNDSWRLAVKSGRNGKDGERGEPGPQGKPGLNGRDLTQLGSDGRKW